MRFKRQHRPVTRQQMADFERERGIRLPDGYRQFLLDYNGGYAPDPGYLDVPGWNETVLQAFLGVDTGGSYSFARENFHDLSPWLDQHFFPFAEDPGGQVFVIDLRQKTYGKVYVRDHDSPRNIALRIDDTGMDETDRVAALIFHPVADSFADFIAMLGPE